MSLFQSETLNPRLGVLFAESVPCLSADRFSCHGTDNRCIEEQYVCDRVNQCWDKAVGTDEVMCSKWIYLILIYICVINSSLVY